MNKAAAVKQLASAILTAAILTSHCRLNTGVINDVGPVPGIVIAGSLERLRHAN